MSPTSSCLFWSQSVRQSDPEIADAIRDEIRRQRDEIE